MSHIEETMPGHFSIIIDKPTRGRSVEFDFRGERFVGEIVANDPFTVIDNVKKKDRFRLTVMAERAAKAS